MSNRYHISYDAIDTTDSSYDATKVRVSLLRVLWRDLAASNIKRPVESTIVFDTDFDDRTVSLAVSAWRKSAQVYYYLSKVSDNYDNAGAGYIVGNQKLTDSLIEEYEGVKHEAK